MTPMISTSYLNSCLKHLVRKFNTSHLKTIYSYVGNEKHHPIYYEETLLFKKMLTKLQIKCDFIEVSDDNFFPQNWNPQSSLLHIPGANSTDLDVHIGSKVNDIKTFIEKGGRFLGWCGGGYWACRKVCYRVDNQTMLHKTRPLALWKGVEEGPLLPFLGNPTGNIGFFHGAVKVNWPGTDAFKTYFSDGLELNVLLSGGGSFIPDQREHRYKVIATYGEHKKAFAGVKTYVGNGIAVLMNPYFTHGADYLRPGVKQYQSYFPEHNWYQIVRDLEGSELMSALCFADMLLEMTQKHESPSLFGRCIAFKKNLHPYLKSRL